MVGLFTKFFNNFSNIEGILTNALGGFIVLGVGAIVGGIIRKIFKPKPPEVTPVASNGHAFYLNRPKDVKKDTLCTEREELRDKILNIIEVKNPGLFAKKQIVITGPEGIGKTLFCQSLYLGSLKYSEIYLGWIECNGDKSIYDIIRESFTHPRFNFKMKNNEALLNMIRDDLDRPCVLFIDQIDRYTSSDEIRELSACHNTSIIVSGRIKSEDIPIIEGNYFSLARLKYKTVKTIFERKSNEIIDNMDPEERRAVNHIIKNYIMGNPFLAAAFASAKAQNESSWVKVEENMNQRDFDNKRDDYIKNQLEQLYKIGALKDVERNALSKLSVFSTISYTEEVFEFINIPIDCVKDLCKTYWLMQRGVVYYLDEVHKKVLEKVLPYGDSLRELIESLTEYILTWKDVENKGFKQIVPYAEDILNKVKTYMPLFMDDIFFTSFAYHIAYKYYFAIGNSEKSREWLGYCNPDAGDLRGDLLFSFNMENLTFPYFLETPAIAGKKKQKLLESKKKRNEYNSKLRLTRLYEKAVLDFIVKMSLVNLSVKPDEVVQAYSDALKIAENFDDFIEKQKYLKEEYCVFLETVKEYDKVKSLCKEHFDAFGFALDNGYSCNLFYRYLSAACRSEDEELIESLIRKEILDALWNNSEPPITIAWSFGELYRIFNKKGNDEMAELCKRRMVVLINRHKCFWHPDIRKYIELSDEEFIEYMHSPHDELKASLNEAIDRGDADALYLEGRYQEKNGNFNEAFVFYERSANNDNLKGICSLALMYYRGPEYYNGLEEPQNFIKAREYWEYCNEGERKHRGSHYWLGMMLYDENYEGCDKELAITHFIKAMEMGSINALKKLLEIKALTASESTGA
jgi:hypothetical protein